MGDASELAGSLATALAEGGATIDCEPLRSVDTAILQLLIAGHRSAVEAGVPLGFINPIGPVLRDALVGHGMISADGSRLTDEHDFWTRAVTPSEGELR